MSIFVDEITRKESKRTTYIEFQRGEYHDACWLEDSINISEDNWREYELTRLFRQVKTEFDYYGLNTIDGEEWKELVEVAESYDKWKKVIAEITDWVEESLKEYGIFTICGM